MYLEVLGHRERLFIPVVHVGEVGGEVPGAVHFRRPAVNNFRGPAVNNFRGPAVNTLKSTVAYLKLAHRRRKTCLLRNGFKQYRCVAEIASPEARQRSKKNLQ